MTLTSPAVVHGVPAMLGAAIELCIGKSNEAATSETVIKDIFLMPDINWAPQLVIEKPG